MKRVSSANRLENSKPLDVVSPRAHNSDATEKYRFVKTIGIGYSGEVKLAVNTDNGEQVAIKIMPKARLATLKDIVRLEREIKVLTLVRHPHIAQLYEVVSTPEIMFLVLEYAPGGELFDFIVHHGCLVEKTARHFFRQTLSAIDYCHRNFIIHRDLKLENLLMDGHLNIKIIDFGFATTFGQGELLETYCGSPVYAAPEMVHQLPYSGPMVDIWALGIVLYVLVCGYLPWDEPNKSVLFQRISSASFDEMPHHLSADVRDLITRILVVDVNQRLPLSEIMCHPWVTEGCSGPPQNYLPPRAPVTEPDASVLERLESMGFLREDTAREVVHGMPSLATACYYMLQERDAAFAARDEEAARRKREEAAKIARVDLRRRGVMRQQTFPVAQPAAHPAPAPAAWPPPSSVLPLPHHLPHPHHTQPTSPSTRPLPQVPAHAPKFVPGRPYKTPDSIRTADTNSPFREVTGPLAVPQHDDQQDHPYPLTSTSSAPAGVGQPKGGTAPPSPEMLPPPLLRASTDQKIKSESVVEVEEIRESRSSMVRSPSEAEEAAMQALEILARADLNGHHPPAVVITSTSPPSKPPPQFPPPDPTERAQESPQKEKQTPQDSSSAASEDDAPQQSDAKLGASSNNNSGSKSNNRDVRTLQQPDEIRSPRAQTNCPTRKGESASAILIATSGSQSPTARRRVGTADIPICPPGHLAFPTPSSHYRTDHQHHHVAGSPGQDFSISSEWVQSPNRDELDSSQTHLPPQPRSAPTSPPHSPGKRRRRSKRARAAAKAAAEAAAAAASGPRRASLLLETVCEEVEYPRGKPATAPVAVLRGSGLIRSGDELAEVSPESLGTMSSTITFPPREDHNAVVDRGSTVSTSSSDDGCSPRTPVDADGFADRRIREYFPEVPEISAEPPAILLPLRSSSPNGGGISPRGGTSSPPPTGSRPPRSRSPVRPTPRPAGITSAPATPQGGVGGRKKRGRRGKNGGRQPGHPPTEGVPSLNLSGLGPPSDAPPVSISAGSSGRRTPSLLPQEDAIETKSPRAIAARATMAANAEKGWSAGWAGAVASKAKAAFSWIGSPRKNKDEQLLVPDVPNRVCASSPSSARNSSNSTGSAGSTPRVPDGPPPPRMARGAFSVASTSSRPADDLAEDIGRVLGEAGVRFARSNYIFECVLPDLTFHVEVCRLEQMPKMHGIKFRRVAGNAWLYGERVQNILSLLRL